MTDIVDAHHHIWRRRDLPKHKLFLRLALCGGGPSPRVINVDGHPAYASAIGGLGEIHLHAGRLAEAETECRTMIAPPAQRRRNCVAGKRRHVPRNYYLYPVAAAPGLSWQGSKDHGTHIG